MELAQLAVTYGSDSGVLPLTSLRQFLRFGYGCRGEFLFARRNVVTDATTYHATTPPQLQTILDALRRSRARVRIAYGDPATGRLWGDVVTGRIGRSMGPVKVPLIIHNARCHGGPAILDHCIVTIDYANKRDGGQIYAVKGEL